MVIKFNEFNVYAIYDKTVYLLKRNNYYYNIIFYFLPISPSQSEKISGSSSPASFDKF